MAKRYHGRTTPETARHPVWTDDEGIKLSLILWKKRVSADGHMVEKHDFSGRTNTARVFNPLNNKTIKILTKAS